MRESVQEYIRTSLILSEIGKLEEVTLDEHEIFSYYNWLAQRAGSSKEMRNVLKDRDKMYSIMNEMMSEKTREHVLNLIKGKLDNDDAEPSDENGAADVAESDDAPESVDVVADEAAA
jgi:FKBP-type peptidyl-prolyl cis-trans isomerase (trigger factor)